MRANEADDKIELHRRCDLYRSDQQIDKAVEQLTPSPMRCSLPATPPERAGQWR